MEPVYLDSAATTRILPEVRDEILHYLEVDFGNAGSYGWHVDVVVVWPQLDIGLPWTQLVAAARDAALEVATHPRVPSDAFATVSWIDRSDT